MVLFHLQRSTSQNTFSEVSLVGITATLFQRDEKQKWIPFDNAMCRLEILKSDKELRYRMVAISNDNRCIYNKWVRTNSSIAKCSDVFLETKQTSSQTNKTESIGLNCAYKDEVGKFMEVFNECINSLQNARSSLPSGGGGGGGLPSSASICEDLSGLTISISSNSVNSPPTSSSPTTTTAGAETAGTIPNFLDLPLPPPPPTTQTGGYSADQGACHNANVIAAMSLPPPPSANLLTISGGFFSMPATPQPSPPLFSSLPSSLTKSNSFIQPSDRSSGSSGTNTPPSLDIFNPTKTITTTTTTTTTTVTRIGAATESVMKTASGRKSLRARSTGKTLSKKEGLAISAQNVEGIQNIGENIEEESLNLLDLVNEQVVNPTQSVQLINQSITKLYEHLQILFILCQGESTKDHHGLKLIKQATDRISRGPPTLPEIQGMIGYNWYNNEEISSTVSGFTNLLYAKKYLVPTIAHLSTSVRVLGLQASLEAEWMSRNQAAEPEKVVVQLAAISRELLNAIARLQTATQAFCSVCNNIKINAAEQNMHPSLRGRSPSTADFINVWDEQKQLKDQIPNISTTTGLKATLNQLVILLTSDSNYDSKFLKTFITTYQSFASPNLLFTKLVERYTVPEWYTTNKQKITTIQQRVIVVLKYWIVNQSSDFDQELVDQIYYFIDNTLISDGYAELSKALREMLSKLLEDRDVKLELLFQMPPRIQFQEDSILSPIELFFECSPQSIAQQLSLIDFEIFKDIEARELLNQNFNKPKMKYKAPNVMRMINRSTQFSFWVASLIVMEGKKEKRIKIFEKILDIAKYLLKYNNYNTLMSLVAGLALTPVHRLKKTKKKLSSSAISMMAECERIFSSKKSFKNYREVISTVTAPCIPYIGINLTDLVFIEEGNPDLVQQDGASSSSLGPVLNFKKRELFYQAWSDISRFQEQGYTFQTEEPLNTFLLHLPVLDEKDLYDLSILVEPR
ncbi:Ras guanine nucleotide exchange factor [Cavenderia fasciculata]|uniref:Ras guanine nucleotide exchange factor n=1 Tax=Cavenderia fasciculata TaxID=261658 RepID=F4PTU9_CACFS|nr:Ras guanine nucleotide exchange factor [Cavenderia fasciculata]EGG20928.1 Ras guanine nucleotide exchange factor [Cavenderia fasciculata]|eukprot:XP_004358778.1 Ras guanine nucleotide exchange factor [Cavenderia fasciculata]